MTTWFPPLRYTISTSSRPPSPNPSRPHRAAPGGARPPAPDGASFTGRRTHHPTLKGGVWEPIYSVDDAPQAPVVKISCKGAFHHLGPARDPTGRVKRSQLPAGQRAQGGRAARICERRASPRRVEHRLEVGQAHLLTTLPLRARAHQDLVHHRAV